MGRDTKHPGAKCTRGDGEVREEEIKKEKHGLEKEIKTEIAREKEKKDKAKKVRGK